LFFWKPRHKLRREQQEGNVIDFPKFWPQSFF
jgi:hypothetical protein